MYDPYGYDAYGYDDYSYYDDYSGGYDYYGADMSYAMPSPQPMGFGRGRAMAAAAVRDSNMKLLFIYWIDACCWFTQNSFLLVGSESKMFRCWMLM